MSYSRRSRYSSRSPSPYYRRGRSVSRSRSRSCNSSDAENPGNNLYVTGLSSRVTRKDVERHFSGEGEVVDVHLVFDPRKGESRGFGFVTMATVEDADRCIKYLDRSVLEGRVITVEKARRRRGRTPTPGTYLGARTSYGYRRSPTYASYRCGYYADSHQYSSRNDRSYSPYYCRRYSGSRSPYHYRRYSRSRSPYYYRRYSRSRSPDYRYHRAMRYQRSYSPDSRSYSRGGSDSPNYRRRYSRSLSRSASPERKRRISRRYRSPSASESYGRRRSYSCSASPKDDGRQRHDSRSCSQDSRGDLLDGKERRKRGYSPESYAHSHSRSVSRSRSVSS